MMAWSMKSCLYSYGSNLNETIRGSKPRAVCGFCPSFGSSQSKDVESRAFPVLSVDFMGKPLHISDQKGKRDWSPKSSGNFFIHAQTSFCVSRAMRWWDKTLKPNMVEIQSAQELVDSLLNAGDRLVIADFYSPGCGGCKALHPKICQLAESNPNVIFLKVNYENLKTMCHSLHIHVLPFFRFYRGAEGRLCSFSCTNATIKKFKDALGKHGTERCSLGPAKGLDEAELMNLASVGEVSIYRAPFPSTKEVSVEDLVMESIDLSGVLRKAGNKMELRKEMLC
ncbi:thioredoxin-like 1-2, chloroplastic [Juglans microcarpa x Juglans regia]|uniref:thioredoxin-like 1-2, chloroplastic n=1 Tax=Juglans microcarpa x Juglans regia TaxID=2249226 RepID=UPI001B7EFD89|nr:thioredoxin-like 1-2, chloroplastic [Juglans microcarpa x Juglans regia]